MVGSWGTLFSFSILGLFTVNSQNPSEFSKTPTAPYRNESCFDLKPRHFLPKEKHYAVWYYNSFREYVSTRTNMKLPRAFFVKKITWDDALEEMAEQWAEECQDGKDDSLEKSIGQHIIESENDSGEIKLKDLIKTWTDGWSHLTPDVIDRYRKPGRGEYDYEPFTQILWWDTEQFGCGRSVYKRCDPRKNSTVTVVKLVCNYFPAGNKVGEPVYISELNKKRIYTELNHDDRYDFCAGEKNRDTLREGSGRRNSGKKSDVIEYRMRNRVVELWPAEGTQINSWQMFNVKLFYLSITLSILPLLNFFFGIKIKVNL